MADKPKARFVAGAVCPSCQAVDRIVIEEDGDKRQRRCVSCGFKDDDTGMAPGIVKGRLEKPSIADERVASVRILDAGDKTPKTP